MKTGLVLEGGALRTIFSSGACDALLDGDLMPDYVVGVSAGIAYGVSLSPDRSGATSTSSQIMPMTSGIWGLRTCLSRTTVAISA